MTQYEATNLAATILSDALHAPVQVDILDWKQPCNCFGKSRTVCAARRAGRTVAEAEREHYVCLCSCHDEHEEEVMV